MGECLRRDGRFHPADRNGVLMSQLAEGGPISEPTDFVPEQCAYGLPNFTPTIPGADWFIDGHRYWEVERIGQRARLRLVEDDL